MEVNVYIVWYKLCAYFLFFKMAWWVYTTLMNLMRTAKPEEEVGVYRCVFLMGWVDFSCQVAWSKFVSVFCFFFPILPPQVLSFYHEQENFDDCKARLSQFFPSSYLKHHSIMRKYSDIWVSCGGKSQLSLELVPRSPGICDWNQQVRRSLPLKTSILKKPWHTEETPKGLQTNGCYEFSLFLLLQNPPLASGSSTS